MVRRLRPQPMQRDSDLRGRVAAPAQPIREQPFFDVAIALAIAPIPKIAVAQLIAEQHDDPLLRRPLGLPNSAHIRRILPVSNSCIIACLSSRALVSLLSIETISASISESTAAIALCSF